MFGLRKSLARFTSARLGRYFSSHGAYHDHEGRIVDVTDARYQAAMTGLPVGQTIANLS
jgi:hypothetical protein